MIIVLLFVNNIYIIYLNCYLYVQIIGIKSILMHSISFLTLIYLNLHILELIWQCEKVKLSFNSQMLSLNCSVLQLRNSLF